MNTKTRTTILAAAAIGATTALAQAALPLEKSCEFRVNYRSSVNLENFPLMVRLSQGDGTGFTYGAVAADGSDIRFCLPDGTVLNHEVALWNTSGESIVYVGVPQLRAGMSLVLHWQKSSPDAEPPAVDAKAVWTNAGYKAVWHFDRYDSTIGGYANSAEPVYHAMPVATAPASVPGAQGAAVGIYGASPMLAEGSGYFFSLPFSVSCWTRYPTARWDCDKASGRIWTWGTDNKLSNLFFNWHQGVVMGDGFDSGHYIAFQDPKQGETDEQTKANSRCKKDTWQFVTGVYNGANSKAYLDAVHIPDEHLGNTQLDITTTTPRYVFGIGGFTGADSSTASNFSGEIDEVRIRECVSSAEWIAAEYDNALKQDFLAFKHQPMGTVLYIH